MLLAGYLHHCCTSAVVQTESYSQGKQRNIVFIKGRRWYLKCQQLLQTFFKHLNSNSKHKTPQELHIPQVISKALASAKTRRPKAANE